MTEPASPRPTPEAKPAVPDPDLESQAEAQEPEPEPWTPERVTEWNAYYDLYITLGVLLLVFVASASRITSSNSSIWTHLRAGQVMAERAAPLVTDPFSYTAAGRRWVNIPWLFEWGHALLYDAARGLAPADRSEPAASAARTEQVGAGVLVAVTALVRTLTALLLLSIRRPGPGKWWSALCALVALGAVWMAEESRGGWIPGGLVLGGIAGRPLVAPETWGMLLLALELYLLHGALQLGKAGALYALVPLFLAWANLDDSFVIGLIVLATTALGRLAPERDEPPGTPGSSRVLLVLVACVAACVLNPSTYRVFPAALEPLRGLFDANADVLTFDRLSFFGRGVRERYPGTWQRLLANYLVIVGVGLASFLLNRRRFSLGRFLTYLALAALWGALWRYRAAFALVFASTVALNGQEWYHDRFGTQGRLGRGWTLWSNGGRAVTIVIVFALVTLGLTAWGNVPGEPLFGFGLNPDVFAFEAAEFLKTAPTQGQVLNTSLSQGDALIWRAYPRRKTFIDSRQHLFPRGLRNQLNDIRLALRDDDVARWKPLLDRYDVTAVMIEQRTAPLTYSKLMQSPNWIPFYDDGLVIMFGRSDARETDLAFFRAQRLDAEGQAYRRTKPVPATVRPPSPVTWMDEIFKSRSLTPPQPHTEAGLRWLEGVGAEAQAQPYLPDPARCLLAIGEARAALARRPDDTQAFRLLSAAYRMLMLEETALLSGIELKPENAALVLRLTPQPGALKNRYRQLVTALNYAVQTTPPPRDPAARQELQRLNLELYELFLRNNYLDLARDRLQAALALDPPGSSQAEARLRFEQLNERVNQIRTEMGDLTLEQQAGPLERGLFALQQGAPQLAIAEFESAEQNGVSPTVVKPQLVDLYCDTGQPEKASELLGTGNIDDPALESAPGMSSFRNGLVSLLLGNYDYAASLWEERALPRLRYERSRQALLAGQELLRGGIKLATNTFLMAPGRTQTQAYWEFDLGLCLLEAGSPAPAAEHFTKALTLAPDLPTRPLIAYYLGKLGKPVPPAPAADAKTPGSQPPAPPAAR